MKAVVYHRYGPPDVLQSLDVPKPSPAHDEVRIKVRATSLNSSDIEFLTATPAYVRVWGLRKPSHPILGSDIAGIVDEVGADVRSFKPGDSVFGDLLQHFGGFAEYACAPASKLICKPKDMTFEEAACLPQAGVVALQCIRDLGQVKAGDKVLINGAGGGAGTFAVQLAKLRGAEVTGVDNQGKLDFMRSVGADHVIDYARENFTKLGRRYNYILDFVSPHSVLACKRALESNGVYTLVGGSIPRILQIQLLGPLISRLGSVQVGMLMYQATTEDLENLVDLWESGQLRTVIDNSYSLDEVPQAMRYLSQGLAKGKLLIVVP